MDLAHSEWNKETSDPAKGKYDFTKKLYIDYRDKGRRPKWHFTWLRNTDARLSEAKYNEGYEPVVYNDASVQFWPEGLSPDANGRYVYGDVVWAKKPLIEYLRQLEYEKKLSDRGFKEITRSFQNDPEMRSSGAEMNDADLEKLAKQFLG